MTSLPTATEAERAREELATNGPREIAAAAAAAIAAAEQRLLFEKLQARRDALRKQVEELKHITAPSLDLFGGPPPRAETSRADSRTRTDEGRKRPRNAMKGGSGAYASRSLGSTEPARRGTYMAQLPILTTSGQLPFEIGLSGSDGGDRAATATDSHGLPGMPAAAAGATRLMPVFSLPAVMGAARFVRRIPRGDTAEEAAARAAEAEAMVAMKHALGLDDAMIKELEAEIVRRRDDPAGPGLVQRALREEASGRLLPPIDAEALRESARAQTNPEVSGGRRPALLSDSCFHLGRSPPVSFPPATAKVLVQY